jgi:hypothetical protein
MAAGLNCDCASGLNPQKRNTEDTKNHREPRRNRQFTFRRRSLFYFVRPSVLSVAFLRVLCVKFRKAQTKVCAPRKYFDRE